MKEPLDKKGREEGGSARGHLRPLGVEKANHCLLLPLPTKVELESREPQEQHCISCESNMEV